MSIPDFVKTTYFTKKKNNNHHRCRIKRSLSAHRLGSRVSQRTYNKQTAYVILNTFICDFFYGFMFKDY